MTKANLENYHLLLGIGETKVYIGKIKRKIEGNLSVSEEKIDRTEEFIKAIVEVFKDSTWIIFDKDKKDNIHRCFVLSEKNYQKLKNKTLKEVFNMEKFKNKYGEMRND